MKAMFITAVVSVGFFENSSRCSSEFEAALPSGSKTRDCLHPHRYIWRRSASPLTYPPAHTHTPHSTRFPLIKVRNVDGGRGGGGQMGDMSVGMNSWYERNVLAEVEIFASKKSSQQWKLSLTARWRSDLTWSRASVISENVITCVLPHLLEYNNEINQFTGNMCMTMWDYRREILVC